MYQKALSACALRTDLANMSDGDMTEIGEKVEKNYLQKIFHVEIRLTTLIYRESTWAEVKSKESA